MDVPLSEAGLRPFEVALGHGGIVAFDDRVSGEEVLRNLWSFAEAESCGRCSPCRVGSRRGLELVARPAGAEVVGAREQVLRSMASGSLCAFGRRVPAAVRSLVRVYGLEGWPT
jgi:NADH-quinone oxidoreductase subunit F